MISLAQSPSPLQTEIHRCVLLVCRQSLLFVLGPCTTLCPCLSCKKVWDNDTVRREYTLELDLISANIDFKPFSAIQYRNAVFFQLNIILWLYETWPLYYGFQDYYLICSTLQLTLCLSFKIISFSVSLFHICFVLKSNQTNKQEEKNERRPNKKNIHGPNESLLRTNFEMPWLSLIYLSSDSCKKD